jgi:hypothetical protein
MVARSFEFAAFLIHFSKLLLFIDSVSELITPRQMTLLF